MPLLMIEPGTKVKVVSIRGGHNLKNKLAGIGIYEGTEIEVISNQGRGPLILSVNGNRVGVGMGIAFRIIVQPV